MSKHGNTSIAAHCKDTNNHRKTKRKRQFLTVFIFIECLYQNPYRILVLCVPSFGTARTTSWHSPYQTVVRLPIGAFDCNYTMERKSWLRVTESKAMVASVKLC